MADLVERQAAIDEIRKCRFVVDAIEKIRGLPSAQPDNEALDDAYAHGYTAAESEFRKRMEKPEPQWIPCSKEPDTDRNVFIARGTHDNMTACIGHYDHDYKQWYEDRNWFAKCLYDGLYWCEMPTLPEPWRGEEHEDK